MNNLQEQNELKANDNNVLPLQNTETAALAYAAAGLSVLPLELPKKNPVIKQWAPLQSAIAPLDEIKAWFTRPDTQVGIVCGKISGNLELVDFDEKHNIDSESLFSRYKVIVNSLAPGLIDRLVIEKTVNKGFHLLYRSDVVEGSQKLAMRPPTKDEIELAIANGRKAGPMTLIETRGEKGYFMCAPSAGYEIIQGSIENIPHITPEERQLLLNAARGFNQVVETDTVIDAPANLDLFDKRPGDDFNIRGDIRKVLRKHGWKMVGRHDRGEYWCRPNKTHGISASFKRGRYDGPNLFAVYSTNAYPLEAGKNHTMFSVYAKLEHDTDWSKAAAALANMGFGSTTISDAEEYLRSRYEFRLNLITNKTEFRKIGEKEYVEIKDLHLNSLYRELERFHILIGIDTLSIVLHSEFVPTYDPFIEYYTSLPKWDGQTDYVGQLAKTVTLKCVEGADEKKKKEEDELFGTYLKKWLVNAVGCAIEPSVTNHTALILVGPQGYYKSTWLNGLVPKKLSAYKFIGTINPSNKDTLLHLSECFLINLDELETLTKHDLGSLKSVMTLPDINVRRPYGHFNEKYVRRASFVGSINKTEFLNDETGSRRFLTFEVETVNTNHSVDMDMVHAQAYSLFKSGFQYWFNREDIQKINSRNKTFGIITTEDELVTRYFETVELDDKGLPKAISCEWLTATEIATRLRDSLNYSMTSDSARKFGTALVRAGFIWKKSGPKRYAVVDRLPKSGRDYFNTDPDCITIGIGFVRGDPG